MNIKREKLLRRVRTKGQKSTEARKVLHGKEGEGEVRGRKWEEKLQKNRTDLILPNARTAKEEGGSMDLEGKGGKWQFKR